MVTENVDIRFRESGARVIKRRIDELATSADHATRSIYLMRRAMFALGGAGILRVLTQQIDMLTNVENRLRLTTQSAENLEAVQSRLFNIARDTRTAFESVATVYSRTALAVRSLGVSQQETLDFTESLSKATILSGASAREANAALIQLSQGMASGTLRGDELRSVLEQLPYVADVIAQELTRMGEYGQVGRGELRTLAADGVVTTDIILRAFQNANDEINRLFDETVPTIGQALDIANTNWLQFLDTMDDTYGVSQKVAQAIIFLSDNIELIVGSLATLATAWTLAFAGRQISNILSWVSALRAGAVQMARITEVENLRAAASVRRAQAQVAANAADQAAIRQGIVQLQQNRQILLQQKAEQAYTVSGTRARNVMTGQFVRLSEAKANLTRTNLALLRTKRALRASGAQLATSTAAQAGAANTLAAANTRLAGAQAASSSISARLARTFPLLAGGLNAAADAARGLWAILAANPIGAIITAITLAVAAFWRWGNAIKVTEDGVVGLKDAFIAAVQLMYEWIQPFAQSLISGIGSAVSSVIGFFASMSDEVLAVIDFVVNAFYTGFTAIPRFVVAVIGGIVAVIQQLGPGAGSAIDAVVDIFVDGFEAVANIGVAAVNKIIQAFNSLAGTRVGELLGIDEINALNDINLDSFRTNFGDGGRGAGEAFAEGFYSAWDATSLENVAGAVGTALQPIGDAIITRARENISAAETEAERLATERQAEIDAGGGGGGSGSGSGSTDKNFNDILNGMRQEIELLRLSTRERERAQEILKIEEQLKRSLTQSERELADATLRQLEAARTQAEVLESIEGPRIEAQENLAALNALYEQGRIQIEDYTRALREMQAAADEASGTLMGGFRAAISSSIQSLGEIGKSLGDVVVSAAGNAADAIVEFAKTGELNIRQFFTELFSQLLKLAAQQLLLRFLGSFLGIPMIGFSNGGSILPGFATGGSIKPSGPGSTDSQIVSFAKRPDERVDILTPAQQNAQKQNNKRMQEGEQQAQKTELNVVNVLDPQLVGRYLRSTDGREAIVNVITEEGLI